MPLRDDFPVKDDRERFAMKHGEIRRTIPMPYPANQDDYVVTIAVVLSAQPDTAIMDRLDALIESDADVKRARARHGEIANTTSLGCSGWYSSAIPGQRAVRAR